MTPRRVTFNRQISPRPIGLHLWLAATVTTSSLSGLTALRNGWPGWKDADARALRADIKTVDFGELAATIRRQSSLDFTRFLQGVTAYRAHPYRREAVQAECIARYGTTRLQRFPAEGSAARPGPPVLLVPSLINRAYILDLLLDVSLARYLARAGVETFLIEWADPEGAETDLTIADLLETRLKPAIEAVAARWGRPAVAGYCMGGLLALALAVHLPQAVAGLAVLATPWDFHAERPEQARALAALTRTWFPAFETLGCLPVDALQALFAINDPLAAFRKFQAFAQIDPESDDARRFVALEDWLNDGIALPLPIARQTMGDWYGENLTGRGEWSVGGRRIDPGMVTAPALAIIPDQDRIVPQGSAMALARHLPEAEIRVARTGHIGMMAGRRAERETWQPLLIWRDSLDD